MRSVPIAGTRRRACRRGGLLAGLALAAALGCGGDRSKTTAPLRLEDATIAEVHAALRAGITTCRDIVAAHLERIAATDRAGPALQAILETNPDALAEAEGLDAARARGAALEPLHCIPVIVKDNYGTADRMHTTAASLTMGDFIAPRDAHTIAKLRAAGAILIAKANMDEWAFGISGYSSRGGQTRNAYTTNRIPGGSSGGSAAAVAAGMGVLATGSDTSGSIRFPSAWNSLVGIKPTLGLLGRTGILPASLHLDVPGPIARTVRDAAAMLGVMSGVDPEDPATEASAGRFVTDFRPYLDREGLRGARLGVLRHLMNHPLSGQNEEVDGAFEAALGTFAARGAVLVDPADIARVLTDDELLAGLTAIGGADFPADLGGYLAHDGATAPIRDFAGLVAAARALGPDVVKNLGSFESILENGPPTEEAVAKALDMRARYLAATLAALDDAGADALVFPTLLCPATPLPGVVDPGFACSEAGPMPYSFGQGYGGDAILTASITGLPEITVPAGYTRDGAPIGISFLGRPFSEPTLVRLAYAFEQATKVRRPPEWLEDR